jgi:hypothetical protein
VARAKRTERAEARRRYRAFLAEMEQEGAEGGETVESEADRAFARAASRSATDDRTAGPRPGQRMGLFAALKGATRSVNYMADLRFAPRLITGTHAVWLPSLVVAAAAAIVVWRVGAISAEEARQDQLVQMLITLLISPYVMLPGLMAGFLAPRASWLAGALVAFVTTIAFGVVIAVQPELIYENKATINTGEVVSTTAALLTLSVPMGVLLAAFSAWYKRFLDLMGTGSSRQRAAAQKQTRRKSARSR